ncbi:Flp pilus assembly protein CpaB [Bordetella sp. FB-8]|uniref:Flp pilus assembly protein CpaB n=1 Tax=Bordetella sp. FB-8 TaxID=1159870 RepID=UPI0009DB34D0|nr:Flp pilus assembly protein CpaB [Bordetella sp. FB-8]
MKPSRWLPMARAMGAYAFAAAAGLAAAWAVRETIQQRTQAIEAQARVPTVSRLVAARDLPAGAALDMASLAVRDVPQDWASSDSLAPEALNQVEGGTLAVAVRSGEPILLHQVQRNRRESVAGLLAAGRRAFSLPAQEIRDLPQHVQPGDRIDLYVSFPHGGRDLTVPLLQGGKVLSVDGDPGQLAHITLEAAAGDAVKVIAARQGGVLTALLRPASDTQTGSDVLPRDLPGLLGMAQPASRRRAVDIIYGDRIETDHDAFVAVAAPAVAAPAAAAPAHAAKRGAP